MSWNRNVLDRLQQLTAWGYHASGESACEPAALTALALQSNGCQSLARKVGDWLADLQGADGSVGVNAEQASPGWPTAWAIVAWQALGGYSVQIERGLNWLLQMQGKPLPQEADMGHNTLLIGWPWAAGTHSWLEPTALAVLALNAVGQASHPRAHEARELIYNRLLPTGGANYGNTTVLGQQLRPHVQPSGIALVALANQPDPDGKISATCDYLRANLSSQTTTVSLCYGVIGLTTLGFRPSESAAWLQAAAQRTLETDASAYKLALLLLAAQTEPLKTLSAEAASPEVQEAAHAN